MKKYNRFKSYIINTLTVISIFIITLIICRISPFGDNILGKSDAINQYKPMLFNFIMNLKHGTLEIFSFTNGLGNPFMFNYTYYLISPLNLIALLFNNGDLMYLSVILIKISLTSVFVTYYSKKYNKSNLVSFIATISYVFSSWFLAYYYNMMWLDTFMIFPILQLGLENLIREKKIYLYIFSLAYLYITNFFLAFSVLVYGLIYYIIRNFFYEKKEIKEKLKNFLLFIVSTTISILLILFYLIILVKVKRQTGLGSSDITEAGYIVSSLDFLKSLFYGTTNITTEFSGSTYPNISTNTIILISLFYFFINKNIKSRDKIFALIGINLAVFSIFIKQFDYILNMFHNVVGLTYRYSFVIIFLAIILFIHNCKDIDIKKERKKLLAILGILLILLLINYSNIEFKILIFNIVFIIIYGIIIFFYNNKNAYKILISIILITQTILACISSIPANIKKEELSYNKFSTTKNTYRLNNIDDNDFLNKNMYTNEDATYLFTSMTYMPVLTMVENVGCLSGGNSMTCHKDNQIFNMLFNIKNEYYLEKIYSVNSDIKNTILDNTNVKKSHEDLIKNMTGIKDIYDQEILKATIKNDISTFKTTHNIYLIDNIFEGTTYNYLQDYKEFTYKNTKDNIVNEVNIYTVNQTKLKEAHDILSKNQIKYTKYTDSHIEGKITVNENQMIFTSIPYDEAWEIKIDGKIVKPTMLLESLIGIECPEGTHTISMKYKTNYTIPILISSITLIGLIIKIIWDKQKRM